MENFGGESAAGAKFWGVSGRFWGGGLINFGGSIPPSFGGVGEVNPSPHILGGWGEVPKSLPHLFGGEDKEPCAICIGSTIFRVGIPSSINYLVFVMHLHTVINGLHNHQS